MPYFFEKTHTQEWLEGIERQREMAVVRAIELKMSRKKSRLAYSDIGLIFDISRQRVSQIAGNNNVQRSSPSL